MRPPSAMPWPSSAVNSGPRRLSPPPRITETYRNSQPTCSTAFCSSPADHPDLQCQAEMLASFKAEVMAVADHAASTIESIVHPHWISVVPHGPFWSMTARQFRRPSTLEMTAMKTFALVTFMTLAAGPALAQDASLAYRGTGTRA